MEGVGLETRVHNNNNINNNNIEYRVQTLLYIKLPMYLFFLYVARIKIFMSCAI